MLKHLIGFIPAKWKLREEVKARGEGKLALGGQSLEFWQHRLGWSPSAAEILGYCVCVWNQGECCSGIGKSSGNSLPQRILSTSSCCAPNRTHLSLVLL